MLSESVFALIKLLQGVLTLFAELNLSGPLYPPDRIVANNSCYDYIIIGAGTAGSVLAARLTENPKVSVLLVEAGENPPLIAYLPPGFAAIPGSSFDYNYTSTKDCFAASAQYCYTKFSSGKCLGGTSSINHLITNRGCPKDYDNRWAKIANDETWNYENVLPYYKKAERLEDAEVLNSEYRDNHGLNGPVSITRQPLEYAKRYLAAFNETGSRTPLDLTQDEAIGYAQSLFILNSTGIRQSTAISYLTPAKLRDNLYVLRSTKAIRIIFKRNRAIAVVAVKNGKTYVYRASKEIIVSAGVFESPKLLMLSGVGPKDHLESFDIPVVADLPVGKDFQDQVAVSIVHKMEPGLLPAPVILDPLKVPFPVITGLDSLNKSQSCADYQMFLLPVSPNTPFVELICALVFQFRTDLCNVFSKANIFHYTLYTLLSKARPVSRGFIRLNSINPFDPPLITTNYFQNSTDLEDMVDYIIDYLKVENSTYFQEVKAELVDPKLEECKNYTFRTKDYWRCYVLNNAGSIYHNSGTCRMGSVVDSRLRVNGVTRLRVVDASAIPMQVSGSPYEPVLMLAEKAADMIKEDMDEDSKCREAYETVEERSS